MRSHRKSETAGASTWHSDGGGGVVQAQSALIGDPASSSALAHRVRRALAELVVGLHRELKEDLAPTTMDVKCPRVWL